MSNFWATLPKHFVGLSPMDGVSDHPFRHIQKKYGNPDVMYTEFTCVEGIAHGATRLLKDFMYDETQRPIVGQIYGHTPEDFRTVALIVCQLGFDGVDINMGCPARNVTHLGSGAALIRTPKLAQEIIKAVQDGVEDWYNGKSVEDTQLSDEIKASVSESSKASTHTKREKIPVSVKTRIGFDKPVIQEWISNLLEMQPATIAIHGRMLKQYYGGLADWEKIGEAKKLASSTDTLVIGNGDVKTLEQAKERMSAYGLDGVLIGRASMGNPWVFKGEDGTVEERFKVAIEHAELFEKTFGDHERYTFLPMRKHLGWYVKEFYGASEVRQKLVKANNAEEVREILRY